MRTARFTEALISEFKAEMGRRDMSSRGLARALGVTPQYVSSRLDGGNPRTGERVVLNIKDLFAFSAVLELDAAHLIQRAEELADAAEDNDNTYALAASDDEDWERRQETEAE